MDLFTVAVTCLALNLYHEARGEPIEGQLAVAQVVLTRAKKEQKKVCEIVLAPSQFSWTTQGVWWLDGKPHLAVTHRPKNVPENELAWATSMRVARRALGREKIDVVGDSSFYHVCSMNRLPHWVPHVEFVKSVGNHCFYRGDGKARGVDI